MTSLHGPLALCKGSHLLPEYDRLAPQTEEVPDSFYRRHRLLEWLSPDLLELGDFILFHNKTVHASLINRTDSYRISVDTRWILFQSPN